METVAELKRKLSAAQKREHDAQKRCQSCSGKGYICDSTYDRTGVDVGCGKCRGTGLPQHVVNEIIDDAFAPYVIWKPTR